MRPGREELWFPAALCVFLVASVILGGATRSNHVGDSILQALSVALLLWGLWRLEARSAGWAIASIAVALIVIGAQVVPLPPQVWTSLPLRPLQTEVLSVIGQQPGWWPLSMAPQWTMTSFLALLPPLAAFIAALQVSRRDRRMLAVCIVSVTIVSCFVGLWQVATSTVPATGSGSVPAISDASGFFVNRNHFAALLALSVVLSAVFALDGIKWLTVEPERIREPVLLISIAAATLAVLLFLGTIVLARSRAGIAMAMAAVMGVVILAKFDPRRSAGRTAFGLILLAVAVILLPASQFALYRVMERFGEDPLSDGRADIAPTAWQTLSTLFPFGSGFGSFVPVYKSVEQPSVSLMGVYVNHAHNDLLETVMELGLAGGVLLVMFGLWFTRRLLSVWRSSDKQEPVDSMLSRAMSIAVLILLAHSLVDYPLRTAALACVFSVACAMLLPPPARQHGRRGSDDRQEAPQTASDDAAAPPVAVQTSKRGQKSDNETSNPVVPAVRQVSDVDRTRWSSAWRSERAQGTPRDGKATSPAAAEHDSPKSSGPPRMRELHELLQDRQAWPKEWRTESKKDDK